MSKERKIRVSVNLHPDMFDRVSALSERVGMPIATLCAVFIGEQVSAKELSITESTKMIQGFDIEAFTSKLVDNPEMLKMMVQLSNDETDP